MNLFGIGPFELVLIMVVALLVLGPEKLPEVAGQIGKAIRDFRRMSDEVTGEFSEALKLDPTPQQVAVESDHPGEVVVQTTEHDLAEESPSGEALEPTPIAPEMGSEIGPEEGVDIAAGLAAIEAAGQSIAESEAALGAGVHVDAAESVETVADASAVDSPKSSTVPPSEELVAVPEALLTPGEPATTSGAPSVSDAQPTAETEATAGASAASSPEQAATGAAHSAPAEPEGGTVSTAA